MTHRNDGRWHCRYNFIRMAWFGLHEKLPAKHQSFFHSYVNGIQAKQTKPQNKLFHWFHRFRHKLCVYLDASLIILGFVIKPFFSRIIPFSRCCSSHVHIKEATTMKKTKKKKVPTTLGWMREKKSGKKANQSHLLSGNPNMIYQITSSGCCCKFLRLLKCGKWSIAIVLVP